MEHIEMVEKLMEKANVSYAEAKQALENNNWDMLDALIELERQGKLLVIAPESTMGVSRTERDPDKLRLLWGHGYQAAVDRLEEVREFFGC